MLFRKQLMAYCVKDYKSAKLPYLAGYKQFLEYYFQHFAEKEHKVDSLDYFSAVAKSHFQELVKHKEGKVSLNISNVTVQKSYLHHLTRIYLTCPDAPFVVESLRSLMSRLGCHIIYSNLMANYHIVKGKNTLSIEPTDTGGETYIWVDIEMHDELSLKTLESAVRDTISDVQCVVRDWRRMQDTLRNILYAWRDTPEDLVPGERVQSYIAFMEWVLKSFTFMSYHGYRYQKDKQVLLGEKWGLATQKGAIRYKICQEKFPEQVSGESHPLVLVTQTEDTSTVHRDTYKDMIVLRVYSAASKNDLVEEHYFTGLLTADAYVSDPSKIPLISQKFEEVIAYSALRSRYSLRRMRYILKSLPRAEILQSDVHELSATVYDILMIQERRVVRTYIRRDPCQRFYSVMVFMPRDMLTTRLRQRIDDYLARVLQGHDVQYVPFFAESVLARLHFMYRCDPSSSPLVPIEDIQEYLVALCASKSDDIYSHLSAQMGQKSGYMLGLRYYQELSEQYSNTYSAKKIAEDILVLNELSEQSSIDVRFSGVEKDGTVSCRLFQRVDGSSISLTTVFPLLTNFGFDVLSERHFEESVCEQALYISEYRCQIVQPIDHISEDVKEELVHCMLAVLQGQQTNDGFNALLLCAGIRIREVEVIRAMCAYLHQIKFALSTQRLMKFFVEYPKFVVSVIKLFNMKFQPKVLKRDSLLKRYHKEVTKFADLVKTSDDERIVLTVANLLMAIVRTNYALPSQESLALKIQSNMVMGIPQPAPLFEFFVYSSRFMGVHLRFSKVARGGLRNSDRPDDVRHEVFELAKTQRLKNTLIVPDGAKGGFVCKRLDTISQEDQQDEVLACYKIFIRSMLSLTDNYLNGRVCRHKNMVIHDEADPYFVVAADKGTATFSPYANAISIEHGYWLGDAFASGGQYGYDHKKMGITAKGAWESVKWHFMTMKRSVYTDPFTVVGIGDMSGDVFGNGMLLSDKICLVAAFGYARIFIDPNPDPKMSYQERLRLFQLPRSHWGDYNPALISPGGGVFLRSDKYITLTPQIKKLLGTGKSKMEPNELIREILKLQVDLLWNGGIGVYAKASTETNFDVMDFHNDACRVNANELNAKVIGEGGNNGFTQLARVEFAQKGGLINTDFIDNSAGVNTSDVEVNYKILFQALIAGQQLTLPRRNAMLTRMTHYVSQVVLRNNFLQNLQINLALLESVQKPDHYIRLVDALENTKLLNRDIEKIPSKRELQGRKKQHAILTRPEMAVLLSYCKIDLYNGIRSIDLSKTGLQKQFIDGYFPDALTKKYPDAIKGHLLYDELVATELTNTMLGETGMLFLSQLIDECNTSLESVVKSYLIVRDVLNLADVFEALYVNAQKISQEDLLFLLGSVQRCVYKSCRWLIRYRQLESFTVVLDEFKNIGKTQGIIAYLPKKYIHRMAKVEQHLVSAGLKPDMASRICESRYDYQVFSLHSVVNETNYSGATVKQVYYQIAHLMKFHKIKERLHGLAVNSRWEAIQQAAIDDDLGKVLEQLTKIVLCYAKKRRCNTEQALEVWSKHHQDVYIEIRRSLHEIIELRRIDISLFVVILSRIKATLDGF